MAVLDWLQQLLGGGDPEAQGAAATSTAMMPAVNQWAQNVGSGQYVQQGLPSNYDPTQSFAQNALNPNSLENALNVALGVGGGSGLGIKAYHGSPYDFSAFDASKIGTGEGAQAYGHGLYFAEHEPVARGYRDALAGPPTKSGVHVNGVPAEDLGLSRSAISLANMDLSGFQSLDALRAGYEASLQRAQEVLQLTPNSAVGIANRDMAQRSLNALDELKGRDLSFQPPPQPGHMYEVNINAEPNQFLNWDKPLSEQPPAVQDALVPHVQRAIDTEMTTGSDPLKFTGGEALSAATSVTPDFARGGSGHADASAMLRGAGIPGIRYLDQGSRGAGQGTSNYVVFDPKIIEILRKYGIIPPAVGAGLLGAADQQ